MGLGRGSVCGGGGVGWPGWATFPLAGTGAPGRLAAGGGTAAGEPGRWAPGWTAGGAGGLACMA